MSNQHHSSSWIIKLHVSPDYHWITFPGSHQHFGGTLVKPAPLLGQHTNEILREWLGLDADQINQLGKDGVI
jgi:crotonobetainyl-CoA:carnitine CoA-transferase CaiB-like acyl-CoA transferase